MTTTSTDYSSYTASSGTSSTGAAAASSAATAYNTFLKLLTTQLRNQDPLNPTATDTFTTQMIQLSSVEQQLKLNDTLTSMASNLSSITAANGLGYVGKTVTAAGDTVPMQDGSCNWRYTLASTAHEVKLSVVDEKGNTVYSTTGDAQAGTHAFSWDGTTTAGGKAGDGTYTLKISAYNGSGNAVSTSTSIVGKVTGVDNSTGSTVLKIGSVSVDIGKVTNLSS
ncbi:MAG: flagellar hook capping FlgD N-terminal domain-containing protein [Rhodospirillaceae bacterium]|nr:flagellar hook capping FlgD N-terminal domain-containing protein [Rhodospirillaceae bacterium]